MTIRFFMHHLGSFRMSEPVACDLARRGRALHLVTGVGAGGGA